MLKLALTYGYPNRVGLQTSKDANACYAATQLIVWQITMGFRSSATELNDKTYPMSGYSGTMTEQYTRNKYLKAYYDAILSDMARHYTRPSFTAYTPGAAQTYEMEYKNGKYTVTLTDSNNMLGDYYVSVSGGVSASVSGNTLTLSSTKPINDAVTVKLNRRVYGAIADFFEMMGNMGSEVFDLEWVQATVKLFTLFGWGLFVAGTAVAIFDVAIEYQCGRANIKTTALNILKGFFACSLIGIVPIELYKFCISLQNTFSHNLVGIASGGINESLADAGLAALAGMFSSAVSATYGLLNLLCMIAFAYCVIKMFFTNIKRGGILLIQIAVGSLYMFSVPRGYADGFNQWCKQVIAICLTAFMQTSLLFLGLMTFPNNMLLGLGIMLAANEVPRIAQHSGLQKGNYRKIKGLSALFTRIKRKYVTDKSYKKATIHNA